MKNWLSIIPKLLILFTVSCMTDYTDTKIGQMESLLSKWEKKKQNGDLKFNDYITIQQEIIKIDSNASFLNQESNFTTNQIKKSKELSLRLEKLITIK